MHSKCITQQRAPYITRNCKPYVLRRPLMDTVIASHEMCNNVKLLLSNGVQFLSQSKYYALVFAAHINFLPHSFKYKHAFSCIS